MRLGEIIKDVEDSIMGALDDLLHQSKDNYILYLVHGDYIPESKAIGKPIYVVNYQVDNYNDETRQRFYSKYMSTYYGKEPTWDYSSEEGEYRLNIEMMIYCHVWESTPFLKDLVRLAHLLNGQPYDWDLKIPEFGLYKYLKADVVVPLTKLGSRLGKIVSLAYYSGLRNSFAHSVYDIDRNRDIIYLRADSIKDKQKREWTFSEFRKVFLYSIIFAHELHNILAKRKQSLGDGVTSPVTLPDRRKMQIEINWRRSINGADIQDVSGHIIKE